MFHQAFCILYFLLKRSQSVLVKASVLCLHHSLIPCLFLGGCNLINAPANQGILREACDFLQYLHLLLLIALEETGEFALCQHRGTAELAKIQPHGLQNSLPHFVHLLATSGIRVARGEVPERPSGWVQTDVGLLFPASLHMPFRLIFMPVNTLECEGDKGLTRVASHQLARVVQSQIVAVVLHLDARALPQTGRSAVERQTDGVKDSGLAGTRLACNQEHIAVRKGRGDDRICVKSYLTRYGGGAPIFFRLAERKCAAPGGKERRLRPQT